MAEWPTPSVTSAEIVDGSIVDADVSASAAIQASKLSGVETPSGAQAKADAGQAAAEATAAADATSKANAAQSGAEATAAVALTAHDADTTAVHGIADTSDLILEGDARLTDERTPTDGSVTAAKLAAGQNLPLLGATFTGTVPGSLNAVRVAMSGAASASESAGGAVNVTTTGHTGSGIVVYSNRGADAAGNLVSVMVDNPAFTHAALRIRYDGVGNPVVIDNRGTGTANVPLTVTSTNPADTVAGFTGATTTRAVVKVTHNGGSGTSGALLTLQKDGVDTDAQGIFGDTEDGSATGKWINLRKGNAEVFVVSIDGDVTAAGGITSGGVDVVLDDDTRLSNARTPTTHASSHAAGGADVVTPLSIAALGLADTRASVLGRSWDFDTNPFDTDLGEWTVVTGTAPTVSGGVATPASSSEHIVLAKPSGLGDVEIIAKIATAGTLAGTGANWALIAKSTSDAQDFIMARYADVAGLGRLELYRRDSGSDASMAISGGGAYDIPLTVSTPYWLRFTVVGNVTTCDLWAAHPSNGGSPLRSVSYTLVSTGATKFGAGTTGRVGLRHSNTMLYPMDTLTVRPLTGRVRRREIQKFTASGTWTAPANALLDPNATWDLVGIGCGGPGASGPRQPPGTATSGGSGGASGSVLRASGKVSDLAATTGTVTIGAVGTPGAAVTTDGTNGNDGTASGNTTITGVIAATQRHLAAMAGGPGIGGGTSSKIGGAPIPGSPTGMTGGNSSLSGNGGSSVQVAASGGVDSVPGGAGGGGGIPASPVFKTGGNGTYLGTSGVGGIGGATDGAAGSVFSTQVVPVGLGLSAGPGPGGGASSVLGAGGAGGSGATAGYGAGGGGGGASLNGSNSGAGGAAGASALAIAFEWTEAG